MSETTIYLRATRADVRQAMAALPSVARGGGTAATALLTRCAQAVLTRIRAAFIVKMHGGTDEAGDSWPPLSPRTIAARLAKQARGRGQPATRPSSALNAKQSERWWQVYRKQLAIYKGNKSHAAAVAWLVLKREGATTLVDKYGYRKVDILRDTGLLLKSISPGEGNEATVFRVQPGEAVIGTNRKGAAAHHHGAPSRNLPQRRLWPPPSKWPVSWWIAIGRQAVDGLRDLAVSILKEGST